MKRTLTLLLIFLLCLSFIACAASPTPTDSPAQTSSSETQGVSFPLKEEFTLHINYDFPAPEGVDMQKALEANPLYQELYEKTNVKVQVHYYDLTSSMVQPMTNVGIMISNHDQSIRSWISADVPLRLDSYVDDPSLMPNLHQQVFSQLAELDSIQDADAQADIRMGVTSLEADMAEPGNLRIKCGLVAQYLIWNRRLVDVVEDAYSPFRPVEPEMETLELPVILEDRREFVTAQQSIPGGNGQIADAVFYPDFPRQRRYDDAVELEVPGLFQTLVYGENGSLQGVNSRWEGSLNLPSGEDTQTAVTAVSSGRVQTAVGTDGLLLTSPVQMQLQSNSSQGIPMVTGLEVGELEEPDASRPSILLRRADGESLWQIAKQSGSTVSAISSANGLEGEPDESRMLLIPVS